MYIFFILSFFAPISNYSFFVNWFRARRYLLVVYFFLFCRFIFIMGTAMNYSFRGMMKRGTPRYRMLYKIVRRSILLFFIGIVLNTNWGREYSTLFDLNAKLRRREFEVRRRIFAISLLHLRTFAFSLLQFRILASLP